MNIINPYKTMRGSCVIYLGIPNTINRYLASRSYERSFDVRWITAHHVRLIYCRKN